MQLGPVPADAPRTTRKVGQVFGQVMAAAVDGGLIAVSPCERVRLPDGSDFEPRFLTPGEVATLADAIDDRYRALVLVAAYGGLRFSEIAGLRRRTVDVLRGRLQITEVAVEAGGRITFKPPQSKAGRRGVSLPTVAHHALTEHLDTFMGSSADALVFTSPQGDLLRATTWRRRYWNPAVMASGLAPLRVHDLRHTAVSLWIEAGDDAKAISTRAGHSSVAFTYDRYGHLFPEPDERSRARLDALIGDATPGPMAEVRELRR